MIFSFFMYGVTATAISTAETLLIHRDIVTKAARTLNPGIIDLEANQTWKWANVHRVPVARYVDRGALGTEKLHKELEAVSWGVGVRFAVRWLGGPSGVKARFKESATVVSSITFAVVEEAVSSRIWSGLLGNLGAVAAAWRPQPALAKAVESGRCSGWGHALHPKCSLRAVRM